MAMLMVIISLTCHSNSCSRQAEDTPKHGEDPKDVNFTKLTQDIKTLEHDMESIQGILFFLQASSSKRKHSSSFDFHEIRNLSKNVFEIGEKVSNILNEIVPSLHQSIAESKEESWRNRSSLQQEIQHFISSNYLFAGKTNFMVNNSGFVLFWMSHQ